MSDIDSALIADARALLATFQAQGCRQLNVQLRPGTRLAIGLHQLSSSGVALLAPHVGTISDFVPAGSSVKAGEAVITLAVLDELFTLVAPESGFAETSECSIGRLVEFGETLAWIELPADD